MRGPLVAIVVLVVSLAGCQAEDHAPSAPADPLSPVFDSPNGPVSVLGLNRNENEKTIDAVILVDGRLRNLSIRRAESMPFPVGFVAELKEADQSPLASIAVSWHPDEAGDVWFREETKFDALEITIRETDTGLREEYRVRGETFCIEYPKRLLGLREQGPQHSLVAGVEDGAMPGYGEFRATLESFEEFYSSKVGNSLNDNIDGEVFASLINDRSFADFLVGGDSIMTGAGSSAGHSADAADDQSAVRICAIAGVCSVFKCLAGGWANFLCVACGGISLACGLAGIGCWISDC